MWSHIFLFPARLMTIALENFEYPWDVETSMALWLGSTIVCQVLFRIKQLFAATQTPWQALWLLKPWWQVLQLLRSLQWVMQLNQSTNLCWYQSPLSTRRNGHERACLVKENKAGPSQEQEEEAEQGGATQSLFLRELWDMQKDFSHQAGEHVITWLLRCWVPSSWDHLLGKGALTRQLAKGHKSSAFGRQLLWSVKERHPFKEDVLCHPGKWATTVVSSTFVMTQAMHNHPQTQKNSSACGLCSRNLSRSCHCRMLSLQECMDPVVWHVRPTGV